MLDLIVNNSSVGAQRCANINFFFVPENTTKDIYVFLIPFNSKLKC